MHLIFTVLLIAFLGYILGSIPFAVIVGRWYGVDVLSQGSKNPGATNVKRLAGPTAGRLVFALDAAKGVMAAGIAMTFFANQPDWLPWIGLVSAILGHSFSIFIHFRGGKGVATTMGGLFVIMPWVVTVGLLVWAVIFLLFRYVSLASIGFALSLPITAYFLKFNLLSQGITAILACFVIIRHRSNIVRILRGEEPRSGR